MKKNEKKGTINTISMVSTADKTIKIYQPQFIQLISKKEKIQKRKNDSLKNKIKTLEKKEKIKEKIKQQIKEENKPKPFEKYNYLDEKILKYHKNPHEYIDYLLEKCFQDNYIKSPSDEEIKKKVEKDYDNFLLQLINKFQKFYHNQKYKLKQLENKIKVDDAYQKNKKILTDHDELISEPIYNGENIKDIFLEVPKNKFNSILNSKNNMANNMINDNKSNFYVPRIANNVISCLNDVKVNIPNNKFISIENVNLQHKDYWNNRKFFDLERDKMKNQEKCENGILNHYKKTFEMQNKIFDDIFYHS
jgi:hypothetical protein